MLSDFSVVRYALGQTGLSGFACECGLMHCAQGGFEHEISSLREHRFREGPRKYKKVAISGGWELYAVFFFNLHALLTHGSRHGLKKISHVF